MPDIQQYLKKLSREELEKIYARATLKKLQTLKEHKDAEIQTQARGLGKLINNKQAFFNAMRKRIPTKFSDIFNDYTFKVARGGRGSAKSHSFAQGLIAYAITGRERILCTRQFQNSIKESVHQTLKQQIEKVGLEDYFNITKDSISCPHTGSEFLFKGLQLHPEEIKSLEGITKTWMEEGQSTSQAGFDILLPTIFRTDKSELWITYNQENEDDPVDVFVKSDPPKSLIIDVNWRDNPWFPALLDELRKHAYALAEETGDWSAYNWIWEGKYRLLSDSIVFWRRVIVEDFEDDPPPGTIFYHGADWGFANDPTVLIRCYEVETYEGTHLYIDREAYGYRTALDETPDLFEQISTSRRWPIYGDASRPETIHFLKQRHFNISSAEKWQGSVEDGVEFLKSYTKIHIHRTNCPNITEEAKLYSYKLDPKTKKVLPVLVDAWNHGWDATRYALVDLIRQQKPLRVSAGALARSRIKTKGRILA